MSSIIKLLRRIGGAKAVPPTGEAGQLAFYKAGTTPTDAVSLYVHDGVQWVELLDTAGRKVSQPVSSGETAPASPYVTEMWFKPSTKALAMWDGAQWSNVAYTNVINTFTKSQIIDVTEATPALRITQKGAGAALLVEDEANPDTTPFTVDADGNVGIGTATPVGQLHIREDFAGPTRAIIQNRNAAGVVELDFLSGTFDLSDSRYSYIQSGGGSTSYIAFGTANSGAPTEKMRIAANGSVGIAMQPVSYPGYTVLSIGGLGSADLDLFHKGVRNFGIYTDDVFCSINCVVDKEVRFYNNNINRFSILPGNGQLQSNPVYALTGTGSNVVVDSQGRIWRLSSSLKYKRDVEPLDSALTDRAIAGLRPVWYRTKEANGDDKGEWSHIGLIAEDVAKIEPRLVKFKTHDVSYDEKGNSVATLREVPEPEDVDYARLSVLLLDHVQRLEKRIADLEARP